MHWLDQHEVFNVCGEQSWFSAAKSKYHACFIELPASDCRSVGRAMATID
jgi:hypothetical protein